MATVEGGAERQESVFIVHLVDRQTGWQLCERTDGSLTDGRVTEESQRDLVRQMAQWLSHFPERLKEMEALTGDGNAALRRALAMDLWDGQTRC